MIISGSSLSFANHRRLTAAAEGGQFGNVMTGAAPTAAAPVAAPVDAASSTSTAAPVATTSGGDSYVSSAGSAGDHSLGAQVLGYLNDFLGRAGVGAAPAAGSTTGGGASATEDPTSTLTGILEKTFGLSDIASISWSYDASQVQGTSTSASSSQVQGPTGQLSDYQRSYDTYEHSTLAAQGSFTTSDGTSYSFSLDYDRERMTHVGSEVVAGSNGGDQGSTDASPGAQLGSALASPPAAAGDGSSDATDGVGGSASSAYRAMQRMMLLFFDKNHDGKIDAADVTADAGAASGSSSAPGVAATSAPAQSDAASPAQVPAATPAATAATEPIDGSGQSASVVAVRSRRISLQIAVYAQAASTQASTVNATA
jgi:hypothetical protein